MAALRTVAFSGLLQQPWQLQFSQNSPEAKHSQYLRKPAERSSPRPSRSLRTASSDAHERCDAHNPGGWLRERWWGADVGGQWGRPAAQLETFRVLAVALPLARRLARARRTIAAHAGAATRSVCKVTPRRPRQPVPRFAGPRPFVVTGHAEDRERRSGALPRPTPLRCPSCSQRVHSPGPAAQHASPAHTGGSRESAAAQRREGRTSRSAGPAAAWAPEGGRLPAPQSLNFRGGLCFKFVCSQLSN